MPPHRIVVVGTSLAGLRTIEALRREGHGGPIVAVGEEPHLPYDRPPLSKQFLKGEWDEDKIALRRQGVDDLEVEWRTGCRAEGLDCESKELLLAGGERLAFDAVVIATGCVARTLPFGDGLAGIHTLRTLDDARSLRDELATASRVAVVGAGFIGMEVAASCRERGLEVDVIEPLPQPLIRGLGPHLGAFVADYFAGKGVAIHCGVGVEGFEGEGRVSGVRLADGRSVPADCVVVGVGARPATDWLEGSGVEVDDGVLCDATGATGTAGIFAVGDCASWLDPKSGAHRRHEHWTSAVEQSSVVAHQLLHGDAEAESPVPYVWSDQFELRMAIAGAPGSDDEIEIGHGSLEEGRCLVLYGREGRLTGAVGFKRPRQLMAARKALAEDMSWDEALKTLL